MKRRILMFLSSFMILVCVNSQELTHQEIIELLGDIATEDLTKLSEEYYGEISTSFELKDNELFINYCWNNNEDVSFLTDLEDKCNSLIIDLEKTSGIKEIKTKQGKYAIRVFCTNGDKNCVRVYENNILNFYSRILHDNPLSKNHFNYVNIFYFNNQETSRLIFNGLLHLRYEWSTENKLKLQEASAYDFDSGVKKFTINLTTSGGVYELPLDLSGVKSMAILDSGASDVSIPKSIESELLSRGIIDDSNYLPSGFYTIADGSTILKRRFVVPIINLEGVSVKNVICSVNDSKDLLLLGRAFLDSFKYWSVNNEKNQLILNY